MQKCHQCNLDKEWVSFHRDSRSSTGRTKTCIECKKKMDHERSERRREISKAQTHQVCRCCKERKEIKLFCTNKKAISGFGTLCLNCRLVNATRWIKEKRKDPEYIEKERRYRESRKQ